MNGAFVDLTCDRDATAMGFSVVVGLDVSAGAGNSHAIKKLEKVEVERAQNCCEGPLFWRKARPGVKSSLSAAENLVDMLFGFQFPAEVFAVSLISQRELVAEVRESIIHRGGRQHQHFGLHPLPDDLIQETLISGLAVSNAVLLRKL